MPATMLCPELIAPVANMLAAAWAAGPTVCRSKTLIAVC
jgi:hypothetical protein